MTSGRKRNGGLRALRGQFISKTGQLQPAFEERTIGVVMNSGTASMTVDAEVKVPAATAQLVRFDLPQPTDATFHQDDSYWIDLCLTPRMRNARGCFPQSWSPHRFEPIGDLFLVPPGRDLHVRSDGGRQASLVCQLHRQSIVNWLGEDIQWTARQLEATLDITTGHIRSLLLRLAAETRHPGFASDLMVELIAGQLAIEIGRFCRSTADVPITGGLASWRLKIIDERLMEVRKAPTLEELASLCGLSVRQLTRGFRTSRGCSIGEYVAEGRIKTAKRLLVGDDSVKSIAYAMGFASPSSFSYAFRRGSGFTPLQFRQHMRRPVH